jgi:hypothetical protein
MQNERKLLADSNKVKAKELTYLKKQHKNDKTKSKDEVKLKKIRIKTNKRKLNTSNDSIDISSIFN